MRTFRRSAAALAASAFAATALVAGLADTATARGGGDGETIRMRDECEPKSFNAAVGPGTCVGDGDTTFEELLASLPGGGDDHWRFNPDETTIDKGERVRLENRGGELHSFTKVTSFAGGGCVPLLNDLLGVPTRSDEECFRALSPLSPEAVLVPAGAKQTLPASHLTVGHNHFQCLIHPWMTTTIHVRGHHH